MGVILHHFGAEMAKTKKRFGSFLKCVSSLDNFHLLVKQVSSHQEILCWHRNVPAVCCIVMCHISKKLSILFILLMLVYLIVADHFKSVLTL